MSNPQSIFVKKPEKGHRYAISDIHGCSKTFKKLLKKIGLKRLSLEIWNYRKAKINLYNRGER